MGQSMQDKAEQMNKLLVDPLDVLPYIISFLKRRNNIAKEYHHPLCPENVKEELIEMIEHENNNLRKIIGL